MDIEINDGEIKINLYELFTHLDEDELQDLASTYSWHLPAYKELVRTLRREYASENFNPNIYNIRKSFFTMSIPEEYYAKEDIIRSMNDTVKEIFKDNAKLNIKITRMNSGIGKMYDYIKDRYGKDVAYQAHKVYRDELYNDAQSDYDLLKVMVDQVAIGDVVTDWCRAMNELLNKEE